jgi:hypothetical protein
VTTGVIAQCVGYLEAEAVAATHIDTRHPSDYAVDEPPPPREAPHRLAEIGLWFTLQLMGVGVMHLSLITALQEGHDCLDIADEPHFADTVEYHARDRFDHYVRRLRDALSPMSLQLLQVGLFDMINRLKLVERANTIFTSLVLPTHATPSETDATENGDVARLLAGTPSLRKPGPLQETMPAYRRALISPEHADIPMALATDLALWHSELPITVPRVHLLAGPSAHGLARALASLEDVYHRQIRTPLRPDRFDLSRLRPNGWAGLTTHEIAWRLASRTTSGVGFCVLDHLHLVTDRRDRFASGWSNDVAYSDFHLALEQLALPFAPGTETMSAHNSRESTDSRVFHRDAWFFLLTYETKATSGDAIREELRDANVPESLIRCVETINISRTVGDTTEQVIRAALNARADALMLTTGLPRIELDDSLAADLARYCVRNDRSAAGAVAALERAFADAVARCLAAQESETVLAAYDDVVPLLR